MAGSDVSAISSLLQHWRRGRSPQATLCRHPLHRAGFSGPRSAVRSCGRGALRAARDRLPCMGRNARSGARAWTSRAGCAGWGWSATRRSFRDNEIDAAVLPRLTDERPEGARPRSLGPRLKLLAAIAMLRDDDRTPGTCARNADAGRRSTFHRGRAPTTHGHVLRPGRLDRAERPAGPRGDAGGPSRLPERRRGRDRCASAGTSPSSWATGCWPTSAGLGRTRTTPSVPCGRAWRSPRLSASSPPRPGSRSPRGSASRPASWSWATSSARAPPARRRWSARRRTWPHGCRRRPRRVLW